jgi:hypothetical protein
VGVDGDVHAGGAVAGEAADEEVAAAAQRDAVVAGGVRPRAGAGRARLVPGLVLHHVVRADGVIEHCVDDATK